MPEVGPDGVQVCTGVGPVLLGAQVTVPDGTQVATGAVVTCVPQVVRW